MKKICDTMPAMLVHLARNCRLGSGYRLLARCVRHAFDSKMPQIDKEMSKLIMHNGEIGISLTSNVPASMKSEIYRTEIVATPTHILCCRCTCQCGSQDNERVVCVHNLPLLLKLSVFIGECLGEHILLELAACWNSTSWEKASWSDSERTLMKKNILALMVANDPSINHMSMVSENIENLLANYKVGTDGEKKWQKRTHLPPKPSKLCPIYKLPFKSTIKLAEIGLKHEGVPITKKATLRQSRHLEYGLFQPQYTQVSLLISASNSNDNEMYECSGFQLLQYRTEEEQKSSNLDIFALTKVAENDWMKLKQLSRTRSHNSNAGSQQKRPKSCHEVTPTPRMLKTPATQKSCHKSDKYTPPSKQRPIKLFRPGNHLPKRKLAEIDANNEPPRKRKKRASRICAKCGRNDAPCNIIEGNEVAFFCVPAYPAKLNAGNPTLESVVNREGRILLHKYVMDRCGCPMGCKVKKYVCNNHNFEWIKK